MSFRIALILQQHNQNQSKLHHNSSWKEKKKKTKHLSTMSHVFMAGFGCLARFKKTNAHTLYHS